MNLVALVGMEKQARTFVIGDIHGALKALLQVLERAKVTTDDTLIFLGDYVDGWSEAAQTIDYLIDLNQRYTCVFILGNHDLWTKLWLCDGQENPIWVAHGGQATKDSYIETGRLTDKKHKTFFNSLKPYYLDAKNRLFLHAGFTSIHGVGKETYATNFYFDRTLWEMALATSETMDVKDPSYPKRLQLYPEIYIGHTPTTNYNQDQPMHANGVWNVDTGAAFMGKLSALRLEDKAVFQSDVVWRLYPGERGRN